jgi:hypothetical protein
MAEHPRLYHCDGCGRRLVVEARPEFPPDQAPGRYVVIPWERYEALMKMEAQLKAVPPYAPW